MPPIASYRMSASGGVGGWGLRDGVRTHPAAEAPGCSPLEAGVVEEEIFGAVAAVDEYECPACVPSHVSAMLLACCVEP